jgi:hypothetical protein
MPAIAEMDNETLDHLDAAGRCCASKVAGLSAVIIP